MATSCAENNAAVLLHVLPPSPPQTATAPSSAANSSSERSGNSEIDGSTSMQWEEF